jgi:D-glycero-D-manno-heptose 1,7-bisphosphate phosphatase
VVPARKAVFLDRDGVVNRNVFYPDSGEFESPRSVEAFELFPWTLEALRRLCDAGYALFIVSNQPNFAKGKSPMEPLQEIGDEFISRAKENGSVILASYYCYHHPNSLLPGYSACDCRKPSPKFLLDAAAEYDLDLAQSWMVGDRPTDIECGLRAGVKTIRIAPVHPGQVDQGVQPHYDAANLLEAANIICVIGTEL